MNKLGLEQNYRSMKTDCLMSFQNQNQNILLIPGGNLQQFGLFILIKQNET